MLMLVLRQAGPSGPELSFVSFRCAGKPECDPKTVAVGEIMARPLPTLDVRTHLDEAYRLLMAGHTGVLATNDGKVVDIVTRIDLIHYWDQTRGK